MSEAINYDDFNLIHPAHYADRGYPHDVWTRLRRESPVHWWEQTEGPAFWAITKHADITAISKQPDLFVNGPRLVIGHLPDPEQPLDFPPTLIQLDPPKHGIYRQLVSKRFTPRALKKIHQPIEEIGREIVEALVKDKDHGECDFVKEVSAPLPIAVIAWLLGVPKEDWTLLFDWTNRIIGAADPDFGVEGQTAAESSMAAMTELFTYFAQLVEARKKKPEDDMVTLFTQLEVDGKKLEPMDVLSWCMIIVIAGNETTRNGTSGGMLAFVEHPDQLWKLQREPELLASAVEEVVRWTSPIIHFARTATADTEVREPRRGGLRRSVLVPDRPQPESPRRVRRWRAFLPGCPHRQAGDAGRLQVPAAPHRGDRTRGSRGAPAFGARRRRQETADPVQAAAGIARR